MSSSEIKDFPTISKGLLLIAWLLTGAGSALVPVVPYMPYLPVPRWNNGTVALVLIVIGAAFGFFYALKTTVRSWKGAVALCVVFVALIGQGWVFYKFKPVVNLIAETSGTLMSCDDDPESHHCADLEASEKARFRLGQPITAWMICALSFPLVLAFGLKIRKGWSIERTYRALAGLYGTYLWIFICILIHGIVAR